MKRLLSRFGIVPLVFAFGLLIGSALTGTAFAVYQPHMYNALNSLSNARNELQMANNDKAGHRKVAMNLVNQAIQQVHWGIQSANY